MREGSEKKTPQKADNLAGLRAVVAAYLVYLGVSLIRDMLAGKSGMAPWAAWVCGLFFIAAGAAFGWYTWKHWRASAEKRQETAEKDDQP